jgi:hypothetical protein
MLSFKEFVTNQLQMAKGNMPTFLSKSLRNKPANNLDPEVAYGHAMMPFISTALKDPEQISAELEGIRKQLQDKLKKYQGSINYQNQIDQLEKQSKSNAITQSKRAITIP